MISEDITMNVFIEECENIFRLKIKFDTVYTSVFFIKAPNCNILVDCATTEADVKECIIPALNMLGYDLSEIKYLVLTHSHGDHAGGLDTVLSIAPEIEVVTAEQKLTEDIFSYSLPGHTPDCIGVFDKRTSTLLSGDGLQGAGVDKYRCYAQDKDSYLQTIEKIRKDKAIKRILFSHAYEPWFKDAVSGRREIEACLDDSIEYIRR